MANQSAKVTAAAILIFTCHAFPLAPSPRNSVASVPSSSARRSSSSSISEWQLYQHQRQDGAQTETSFAYSSNVSARLNPLLTSFLLRSVRTKYSADPITSTDTDTALSMHAHFTFSDATKAMAGLSTWESSLRKFRLPTIDDFPKDQICWPEEPLFSHVFTTLSQMGLPRLACRHPEIMTSVLLGVAKIVVEFIATQRQGKMVISEDTFDQEEEKYNLNEYDLDVVDDSSTESDFQPLSTEELENLAVSLANGLGQEWNGVVQGVAQLDKVFGYDHGLLDLQVIRSCNY